MNSNSNSNANMNSNSNSNSHTMNHFWKFILLVNVMVIGALFMIGEVFAQQRSMTRGIGDLNTAMEGFRAVMGIATAIVPFALLAYWTWKLKPKDWYDAALMAMAWCALAYIIR